MDVNKILYGRRLLLVDDEPDVLETLVETLEMCKIDTAASFDEGRTLLESYEYDVAVLDIMGVKGFDLLKIANERDTPALMLTAHALTEESLKKSAEEGASYFAPKDEMENIALFVADIIVAKEEKKNAWVRWFDRLGRFYDDKFVGPNWREREKEFWDKKLKEYSGI
jgi:DNA-binding NtrC family response regulator